jgi:cytochrome P450
MRAPLYSEDPKEILDSKTIENPYPLFARLRREHPIARIGDTGVHLVSTWQLIEDALHREADFSAHLTGVLMCDAKDHPTCFELPSLGAANVIATADEPEHAAHRALAGPRLAAGRIAGLEGSLRGWARDALQPWLGAGGGDFAPLAERVPALAVAHVLGLPSDDVDRFRVWSMIGGDMLAGDVSSATLARLAIETGQMVEYLGEHLDAAMQDLNEDAGAPLLHSLGRGVQSRIIGRDQALGIAVVMFGAGGESTAALIGSTIRTLAENPVITDSLRREPEKIPRFIEEVLRLETPFKFHYRSVRRPCRLGGFDLEPGDRLMLLWASANRDSEIIEDPNDLRLDRRFPKRHLSFGRGSHFCIGAALARLETRVMVEELLNRCSSLRFRAGARPRYARSIFVRRLERLELEVS